MAQAAVLVAARSEGAFRSVADVGRRCRVPPALLARLAAADAFRSLGLSRQAALWRALVPRDDSPLFAGLAEEDADLPAFPELSASQQVVADYEATGLSLIAHPIALVRPDLDRLQVLPAAALARLPDQTAVRAAGLVLVRQRPPTANGTVFMTLEDETGTVNLIVWRRTWEHFRVMAQQAAALLVEGQVERAERVIHVCPSKMEDLSFALRGLAFRSRDFR